MLTTEDQARTKWCSEARISFPRENSAAVNRDGTPNPAHGNCNCIASHCMKWRWWDENVADAPSPRRGFCGLASHPVEP